METWDAIPQKVDELLSVDIPKDSPEFQNRVDQSIDEILKINRLRNERDLSTFESALEVLFEKGLSYEKNPKLFPDVRLDDPHPVITDFWRTHTHPDYQQGGYLHDDVVYATSNLHSLQYMLAMKWAVQADAPKGFPVGYHMAVLYSLSTEEASQVRFNPAFGPEEEKDWKNAGYTLKEIVEKIKKENEANDVFHQRMTPEQLENHCFEVLLPSATVASARYIATFENSEQIHKDLISFFPLQSHNWIYETAKSKMPAKFIRKNVTSNAAQFRESDQDYGLKIARVPDAGKWTQLYGRIAQFYIHASKYHNLLSLTKAFQELQAFATDESVKEIEALIPMAKKFENDHEVLIQECREHLFSLQDQMRRKEHQEETAFVDANQKFEGLFQKLSKQQGFSAYEKVIKAQITLRKHFSRQRGKNFVEFSLDEIHRAPKLLHLREWRYRALKRKMNRQALKIYSPPTPEDITRGRRPHQQFQFPSSRRPISKIERRRAFRPTK
ncbi:MAG: hypothetical protein ACOY3I_10420 [Verrucomicrobiota bacterium]